MECQREEKMPGKYYAVKKGRKPGVYQSWAECKAMVDGFPGAVYKSFKTREEALLREKHFKTGVGRAILNKNFNKKWLRSSTG